MTDDLVMITASWDSGPFGTWYESASTQAKIDAPSGYGDNTVRIPRSVWEAYGSAKEALWDAEKALTDAVGEAVAELRAKDPRWVAELERRS